MTANRLRSLLARAAALALLLTPGVLSAQAPLSQDADGNIRFRTPDGTVLKVGIDGGVAIDGQVLVNCHQNPGSEVERAAGEVECHGGFYEVEDRFGNELDTYGGAIRVDEGGVRVGGVEVTPGGIRIGGTTVGTGGVSGAGAVNDEAPVTCDTGEICDWNCPLGYCDMRCESGASCEFSCTGGYCAMRCAPGAVCDLHCTGGFCAFDCSPSATCRTSCIGDGCTGA